MRRNCTLWARSQYPCVAEAEGLPLPLLFPILDAGRWPPLRGLLSVEHHASYNEEIVCNDLAWVALVSFCAFGAGLRSPPTHK